MRQRNNSARSLALVLGNDELAARRHGSVMFARTPLEMIQFLEQCGPRIRSIVLAGDYAHRGDVASFLREDFPYIDVCHEHSVDGPQLAFA